MAIIQLQRSARLGLAGKVCNTRTETALGKYVSHAAVGKKAAPDDVMRAPGLVLLCRRNHRQPVGDQLLAGAAGGQETVPLSAQQPHPG